jgi:hypothetical protein
MSARFLEEDAVEEIPSLGGNDALLSDAGRKGEWRSGQRVCSAREFGRGCSHEPDICCTNRLHVTEK